MVNVEYVKKRRKRIIAAIVSGVSASVVGAFAIVAFIGQQVGSFTVSLNNSNNAKIALSTESTFETTTSHLQVDNIPLVDVCSINSLNNAKEIDNEKTDMSVGGVSDGKGGISYLKFFKYTFFLKNTGEVPVAYDFTVSVTSNLKPTGFDYDLVDLLRVRVYENYEEEEHESSTYAKKEEETSIEGMGQFINDTKLVTLHYDHLDIGDYLRYTVAFWLEGDDPQCEGEHPGQCSIMLGVDIAAYEI